MGREVEAPGPHDVQQVVDQDLGDAGRGQRDQDDPAAVGAAASSRRRRGRRRARRPRRRGGSRSPRPGPTPSARAGAGTRPSRPRTTVTRNSAGDAARARARGSPRTRAAAAARWAGRSTSSSPPTIAGAEHRRARSTSRPGRRARRSPQPIAPSTTTIAEPLRLRSSSARRLLGCRSRRVSASRSPSPAEPVPTSGASTWCTTSSWPAPCTSPRCSIAMMSASTTRGWNCLPEFLRSSLERGLLRQRLAVRAGRGHRVERVGDRDDVRLDRLTAVVGDRRELRGLARRARRDRARGSRCG